jgi:hypothetical protein
MDTAIEKKKDGDLGSALLALFFFLSIIVGAAIYALPNYIFIKPETEFDLKATYKTELNSKTQKLKSYDFSIFNSSRFNSLRQGDWDFYKPGTFVVGNKTPFPKEK